MTSRASSIVLTKTVAAGIALFATVSVLLSGCESKSPAPSSVTTGTEAHDICVQRMVKSGMSHSAARKQCAEQATKSYGD